jgi:hypothetical protein
MSLMHRRDVYSTGGLMANSINAKQVRGDRLIANVLEATIAELSRLGADGISVESIAERAQVNKTSIYRRWATPDKLVRDAHVLSAPACEPRASGAGRRSHPRGSEEHGPTSEAHRQPIPKTTQRSNRPS